MDRQLLRFSRKSTRGSLLALVLIVISVIWIALASTLIYMRDATRMEAWRIEQDRGLMIAEAGLAQGVSWLVEQSLPPRDPDTRVDITDVITQVDYAAPSGVTYTTPPYELSVGVWYEEDESDAYWTIVSNATYNGGKAPGEDVPANRRVQVTVNQTNFARYESFINYRKAWGTNPNTVTVTGLDRVYFGPYHVNSGVGFFPNLWFVDEASSSAPSGQVRVYNTFNDYWNAIFGKSNADQYVNILNYYTSNYSHAPKFYEDFEILDEPILFPDDLNIDDRSTALRENAGVQLPVNPNKPADPLNPYPDYPAYVPAKGPNFAIQLIDPSGADDNGQVRVRQYLGKVGNNPPQYGPPVTYNINDIGNALIVRGNIVMLEGTLDGNLTIGAFQSNGNDGQIGITNSLIYESRAGTSGFQYSDAPDLFTTNGADVNLDYVDTLRDQVNQLDDILGLVAEGDVMVKERDLEGNKVGNGSSDPLYLDAIVMSTGSSTSADHDGGFGAENHLTRTVGRVSRLGGSIQNEGLSWALYSSGNQTAGLAGPSLFDFRAVKPGQAPPFFPTTGKFEITPNTWAESLVGDAAIADPDTEVSMITGLPFSTN